MYPLMALVESMRPSTGAGRPSRAVREDRQAQARAQAITHLKNALQNLNHPSRLSDSPLCQLEPVRDRAEALSGYFPRARLVREAVAKAHAEAWAELAGTGDEDCLVVLGDALAGLTRDESAARRGVSPTEISRRRREAAELIATRVLELLGAA